MNCSIWPYSIKYLILLFIVPVFSQTSKAHELKLRYQDLQSLIEQQNKSIAAGNIAIEAADVKTGHLKRSFLPEVGVHVGIESFKTGPYLPTTQVNGGLDVSMNVYRGGKDKLEEQARIAQVKHAEAYSKRTYYDELSQAQILYWDIAYQQELTQIITNTLQSNDRGYQAANQRFKRGLVSQTDLLEFTIFRSQLQEALESANHELKLLSMSISGILGYEKGGLVYAETQIKHDHDNELTREVLNVSDVPEITTLNINKDIADIHSKQAKRWWVPEVELYGTYGLYTLRERFYPDFSDRIDIAGGFRLHIPLFDRLHGSTETHSSALMMQVAEKLAEQRMRSINASAQVTQGEMIHLHELIHVSEKRIQDGKAYLNQTIGEYNRGVKNSPDVLSAIERLQSFERQYLERKRDYNKAKVKLLTLLARKSS